MFLCNFTEYGADNGISMRDCCESEPYEGMDKIVAYLREKGEVTLVSPGVAVDRFTGERIKGLHGVNHYTDGKYRWCGDLAYHVEKYNLRLPKEFEDYVLSGEWEQTGKSS